ncbi:MAG: hypothetical protein Q9178_007956 [Gyalolechia marmorata]
MADQSGSGYRPGYEYLEKTRKALVGLQEETTDFWDKNWPYFLNTSSFLISSWETSSTRRIKSPQKLSWVILSLATGLEAFRRGEDRQKIVKNVGPYSKIKEEKEKLEKLVEEEKAKKSDGKKPAA